MRHLSTPVPPRLRALLATSPAATTPAYRRLSGTGHRAMATSLEAFRGAHEVGRGDAVTGAELARSPVHVFRDEFSRVPGVVYFGT